MKRRVEAEILDGLAPDDPEAIGSRRDLRRINFMMGNERWILSQVGRMPEAQKGVVELGAGGGDLLGRMVRSVPAAGVDLVPRPAGLAACAGWHQEDLFECLGELEGGVLVANLFLHHFEGAQLAKIGKLLEHFDALVCVEPLRTRSAMRLGKLCCPMVNRVTRNDMLVSIEAGFLPGELSRLLELEEGKWAVSERCSWRGGLRVLALRT